jgi:hypothetical protein
MPTIQKIPPRPSRKCRSTYASPVKADNKGKRTADNVKAKTVVKKGTPKTPPKSPAAEKKNGKNKKNQGSSKQQSAGSPKDTVDVAEDINTMDDASPNASNKSNSNATKSSNSDGVGYVVVPKGRGRPAYVANPDLQDAFDPQSLLPEVVFSNKTKEAFVGFHPRWLVKGCHQKFACKLCGIVLLPSTFCKHKCVNYVHVEKKPTNTKEYQYVKINVSSIDMAGQKVDEAMDKTISSDLNTE